MNFELSDEQAMIRDAVREFVQGAVAPRADVIDRSGEFPADLVRQAGELDLMGIINARVVSFGRYGRTKKIRLGVEPRAITSTFGSDGLVRGLLEYAPKSLPKQHNH